MHLCATSEDDVRHVSILLSDALHTMSLPVVAHGQMFVVRSLPLGRISTLASSTTLALRLERVLREVLVSAVPFDLPSARSANAVFFPGHPEAIARLARLLARGVAANEWFWPAVVPAWASGFSRGERWLSLLDAAHTQPGAALVAAGVVCEAMRASVEDEMLCAIPPGRGADWLQLGGWGKAEPAAILPIAQPFSTRQEEIVRRWQRLWGSNEERLVWLVIMLVLIEQPALVADKNLPGKAARWLTRVNDRVVMPAQTQGNSLDLQSLRNVPAPVAEAQLSELNGEGALHSTEAIEPSRLKHRYSPPKSLPADVSRRDVQVPSGAILSRESLEGAESKPLDSVSLFGSLTSCAGLLFLVPVLERLCFANFLALHPALLESGFPVRLLQFIARRVGVKSDDPLVLALGNWDQSEAPIASLELPGPVLEILARPAPRAPLDTPLMAWLTAVRRWGRRYARIGLASLVCRSGRIAVTRTHLDLLFDLADCDLRVRRAALDVDPGWVPWLHRIVQFHYLERHELSD